MSARVRAGTAALRASAGSGAPPFAGTEHQHQVALVEWARWMVATGLPELAALYAIPNGGLRLRATAGKLRAEGVQAGYPDLGLDVARLGFHGLRIEMKRPALASRGFQACAPEQRVWLQRLAANGYAVHVAFGVDAGKAILLRYFTAAEFTHLPGDGLCITLEGVTVERVRALGDDAGPIWLWQPVREAR